MHACLGVDRSSSEIPLLLLHSSAGCEGSNETRSRRHRRGQDEQTTLPSARRMDYHSPMALWNDKVAHSLKGASPNHRPSVPKCPSSPLYSSFKPSPTCQSRFIP